MKEKDEKERKKNYSKLQTIRPLVGAAVAISSVGKLFVPLIAVQVEDFVLSATGASLFAPTVGASSVDLFALIVVLMIKIRNQLKEK